MDEELGVKVTRLRRRLSLEADGAQSPATPSTPTKKRVTRLAKPALELIDENVTENVPKKATRKSIARDVAEPTEDRPVTPARRSARIRSNTSLVLESVQNVVDSPRARRAASRRNSQLGSDAETTTTPAKQNRRGRRDSTSSVEQLAITNINEKATVQVAEVIAEEPEKETSKVGKSDDQSPTLRKSPRLKNKMNKSLDEAVKTINDKQHQLGNTSSDGIKITWEISPSTSTRKLAQTEQSSSKKNDKNTKIDTGSKVSEKKNLSFTSTKLINEIATNPKKSSVINKSTSEIEKDLSNENNYRKRTKSWTTITSDMSMEKDNHKNILGSGDGPIKNNEKIVAKSPNKSINKSASPFNSIENKENINFSKAVVVVEAIDTVKLLEKAPSKDIEAMVFIDDSDSNSDSIGKLTIDLQNYGENQHNDGEDQCVPVVKQITPKRSSPSESFSVEAMDIDETIPENVTINDFSSREDEKEADSKQKSIASEDSIIMKETSKRTSSISQPQESKRKSSIGTSENCNNDPKVFLNKSDRSAFDNSQRKSSITQDEENYEKLNVIEKTSKRKSSLLKVEPENDKRKSSVSSQFEDDKINVSASKSKKKSLTETASQSLEKTSDDNKSTLVLSELRDMSSNEVTNVSKSPNNTNNELSKSVNILAAENDKKSPSLNYSTSTPLQQKPLQKVALPINTSIIGPNASSKITTTVNKTSPNKRASNAKSDSSDNESDGDLKEKSKMIDDEAEEASDNYESGDSRNDEERQYEQDHEIVETGETLESEQEFSNDSDYEKDSFIVSSDAEDDDLLSGSGDDLSLTGNELKMTKKSKKKFDERKLKEQKKASKEMYESRHKLNESDKSTEAKSKKSKRQRLESSVQESDKDDETEPKKKNRLRIDSSQDLSLNNSNADESIRVKKKKTKRLSESVCEDDAHHNEKEITICNQSTVEINDPLSLAVKQEPETPQKGLDMSTENIEEVQVDSNASIMMSNETTDPLQATVAYEESDSDISENMEIKANYDSVLENLNKSNNKRIKTTDTSLDFNVNKKDKVKEPLVNELNLTQAKKSKKTETQTTQKSVVTQETTSPKIMEVNDDGDASDSIDMRLLFPEDSNDSETNSSKFKPDDKQQVETADVFIPLKRTEAKTNLRESFDLNLSKNELELDTSKKKNKNRKSSQCILETATEPEDTNVSFFIDTKGTYEDMDSSEQSNAKKNKKKQKTNDSMDNDVELTETLVETAAPEETLLDVSVKSDKKKKKKNKSQSVSQTDEPESTNLSFFIDTKGDMDASKENSVKKNKKNQKAHVSMDNVENDGEVIQTLTELAVAEETAVNVSAKSDKKKKKNKSQNVSHTDVSHKTDVNFFIDTQGSFEDMDSSAQNSGKKNKKKKKAHVSIENVQNGGEFEGTLAEVAVCDETFLLKHDKKKKKKIKLLDVSDTAPEESPVNVFLNTDKKKNKSLEVSQTDEQKVVEETPVNMSENSDRKKKNKKNKTPDASQIIDSAAVVEETPVNMSENSDKKKKNKKNKTPDTSQIIDSAAVVEETPVNMSENSDKKKKNKKNKTPDASQIVDSAVVEETPVNMSENKKKKNKKNKTPDASQIVDSAAPDETVLLKCEKKNKKKKPKSKTGSEQSPEQSPVNIPLNSDKKINKKNKSHEVSQTGENTAEETPVNMSENSDKKKKKKKNKTSDAFQIADTAGPEEELVDVSVKSDKKKKKKNKSFEAVDNTGEESDEAPLEMAYKSGKNNPECMDPEPNINALTNSKNKFKKKKKKNKNSQAQKDANSQGAVGAKKRKIDATSVSPVDSNRNSSGLGNKKRKLAQNNEGYNASSEDVTKNKSNKKRKASEVFDAGQKKSKVFKETSLDKVHIPRLPESIVNKLNDKPQKELKKKTHVKAIATMPFQVEQAQIRKNKPSNYLEQSIYLNDSPVKQKQKTAIKHPKVLPFTPTVVTSGKGYTSTFKINVLPQETQFVAQASDMTNFKSEFLANQRIKKLRTFEHFKRQRSQKLAKF